MHGETVKFTVLLFSPSFTKFKN